MLDLYVVYSYFITHGKLVCSKIWGVYKISL